MVRYVLSLVAVLVLSAAVQAENIRGVVKSVEGKTSVTLTVTTKTGPTERTLELIPNVPVLSTVTQGGRLLRRRATTMQVNNGLSSLQINSQVMCVTEMRDGREVVTQIMLEGVR